MSIREVYSLLDSMLADLETYKPRRTESKIPVRIEDCDRCSFIEFAIPGVVKEEISLTVTPDKKAIVLSVAEGDDNDGVIKVNEIVDYHGKSRQIDITNDGVYDLNAITSSLHDGILLVTLPKIEKKTPQSIKIEIK